ncbi:MAG: phosphopantothenoylcysteine decarboxylase [Pirellulales bacterium]|nr:phosphopantothenoylcysteine decarboxylase [Pirellulales bacterium]
MTTAPREIVLAVTGGVAAYKVADVVSKLSQAGHGVTVAMSRGAQKFVGPATFAALSGRPVVTRLFDPGAHPLGAHIELAERAQLLVVAPATARFMAQAALGLGDDLVSTLYLCCRCPVLIAPAMNSRMWEQPAVQRNLRQLREDGVHVAEPGSGWLSCRQSGTGRMAEPAEILARIHELLAT